MLLYAFLLFILLLVVAARGLVSLNIVFNVAPLVSCPFFKAFCEYKNVVLWKIEWKQSVEGGRFFPWKPWQSWMPHRPDLQYVCCHAPNLVAWGSNEAKPISPKIKHVLPRVPLLHPRLYIVILCAIPRAQSYSKNENIMSLRYLPFFLGCSGSLRCL